MAATPPPSSGAPAHDRELATLAGGCFWCTEAVLAELRGVERVIPGYAGGSVPNPTYEQVCSGSTGHAEAVQATFDPKVISFDDLLRIFLTVHDPTTLNRQGPDSGTQYRSAIFYTSDAQRTAAERVLREVEAAHLWPGHLVTELAPLRAFYPAEEYHREYFRRNPGQGYCRAIIAPKVAKFRHQYLARLK
jgi:peptide-methionine (S)-S-oxide reductase